MSEAVPLSMRGRPSASETLGTSPGRSSGARRNQGAVLVRGTVEQVEVWNVICIAFGPRESRHARILSHTTDNGRAVGGNVVSPDLLCAVE